MKLEEVLTGIEIYITNEERRILDSLDSPCFYESFQPREQFIIDSLVRKSLISKLKRSSGYVVVKNEF